MSVIQVFEYGFLKIGEQQFQEKHWTALSKLNELHESLYFDLRHNGVAFKNYVGVIRVAGLTIEVLPKIQGATEDKQKWQKVLIQMLCITRHLNVKKVGEANVSRQQMHLLDVYFEWYLREVRTLIHKGLIKKYYKEVSNVKALKGKLEFAGQIQKNLVHKERFYTTHQVYGKDHLIHQILFKALSIVEQLSKGTHLYHECKSLLLDFPEVSEVKVTSGTFDKLHTSRKTAGYETALKIARLIILNYAPDVRGGNEEMLAILFDMNTLWEQYILEMLKKGRDENILSIEGQAQKVFWNNIKIRPDIVVTTTSAKFIIDTKWKNIGGYKPSTHDLRQMYVYNDYWNSFHAMLLYPSLETIPCDFKEFEKLGNRNTHHCGIGQVTILNKDFLLDPNIGVEIIKWVKACRST